MIAHQWDAFLKQVQCVLLDLSSSTQAKAMSALLCKIDEAAAIETHKSRMIKLRTGKLFNASQGEKSNLGMEEVEREKLPISAHAGREASAPEIDRLLVWDCQQRNSGSGLLNQRHSCPPYHSNVPQMFDAPAFGHPAALRA